MRPGYESRVYGGYGQGDASRVGERTGFGGADGCEPVEVWECVDGCPVAGVDASERTAGGDHGPARYFPAFHDPGDPFADVAVRYAKKAGRGERPTIDGRSHLTVKPLSLMRWLCRPPAAPRPLPLPANSDRRMAHQPKPEASAANPHPPTPCSPA